MKPLRGKATLYDCEVKEASYDNLARVFRTEHFPGASTNKLQFNSYYERRDLLVATGDEYGAHNELAYDGAARNCLNYDEFCTYDELHRLKNLDRGDFDQL
jgi:hypothetical protein